MEKFYILINILVPIALLVLGYVFGSVLEKRHFVSLLEREQKFLPVPAVTFDELDPETNPQHGNYKDAQFVSGSVVVSVDYFKRFLAALRNIFGGRVSSYETLIDRARREAILRMKEAATGANTIANVRVETSTLSSSGGLGSIEVHAYGTALYEGAPADRDSLVDNS